MFLALDSGELEISNAVADFLGNEYPLGRLHETPRDPHNLSQFAELGWLGLAAPEAVGGSGLSIVEEMLFFRELGRVAGPLDIFTQVMAIATAREDAAICGELVTGQAQAALLVEHVDGRVRLLGSAEAPYAVAVTPAVATLYQFDGRGLTDTPCLDRSVAMLVGGESAVEPVVQQNGNDVWRKGQIGVAAMMIGLAERALEMIVEYARERQTFGRPIGAYQAVRHPCADMAVRVEAARSQLFYAATALREGHPDAGMQIDAARVLSDEAARTNADTNIQLHGGIGITDEYDAHLLLERANVLGRLLGGGKRAAASLLAGQGG